MVNPFSMDQNSLQMNDRIQNKIAFKIIFSRSGHYLGLWYDALRHVHFNTSSKSFQGLNLDQNILSCFNFVIGKICRPHLKTFRAQRSKFFVCSSTRNFTHVITTYIEVIEWKLPQIYSFQMISLAHLKPKHSEQMKRHDVFV